MKTVPATRRPALCKASSVEMSLVEARSSACATRALLAALLAISCAPLAGQGLAPERPPAVPLIAHDPYFSIWSTTDKLTDSVPSHWTGKPNSLFAAVRIDGHLYRVMGRERQTTPALDQTRLDVLPTRTVYEFSGAGVKVGLTFFTPALPDDLDILSAR